MYRIQWNQKSSNNFDVHPSADLVHFTKYVNMFSAAQDMNSNFNLVGFRDRKSIEFSNYFCFIEFYACI